MGSTLQRVSDEVPIDSPGEEESADGLGGGEANEGLRERIAAAGEKVLGRIAQDLLENQWVNSAMTAAFEARGRATQMQEVAMDFLNLPSAAHVERLTRRVRSVSQRLEAIEDALTRLEDGLRVAPSAISSRLDSIEEQLAEQTRLLAGLVEGSPGAVAPGQERMRVEDLAGGDESEPDLHSAPPMA